MIIVEIFSLMVPKVGPKMRHSENLLLGAVIAILVMADPGILYGSY